MAPEHLGSKLFSRSATGSVASKTLLHSNPAGNTASSRFNGTTAGYKTANFSSGEP